MTLLLILKSYCSPAVTVWALLNTSLTILCEQRNCFVALLHSTQTDGNTTLPLSRNGMLDLVFLGEG